MEPSGSKAVRRPAPICHTHVYWQGSSILVTGRLRRESNATASDAGHLEIRLV